MRERQRAGDVSGPAELAAVQTPCSQPHADAVVHEHLYAVGSPVGEEVGVVRSRGAEDGDDLGERRLGAGAHVQGFDGHRSNYCKRPPSESRDR